MSERERSVLLDDIRISIETIQHYTAGLDEGSFVRDEKTIDAVVVYLESRFERRQSSFLLYSRSNTRRFPGCK